MDQDSLASAIVESPPTATQSSLAERYVRIRAFSDTLCETLEPEDCCIQSMPDVSPTRWHLAHTTWFFETFVLSQFPGYEAKNNQYAYLFNSYYNAIGEQFPRARRGLLSRPSMRDVRGYRRAIDAAMIDLLEQLEAELPQSVASIVELGLNHEQQHQELMLTDIKHVFSCNPLFPVYRDGELTISTSPHKLGWDAFDAGVYWIGHAGQGFAYDNETPSHRVFLEPFELGTRLISCAEYLEFMLDNGYQRPDLWLSEGWRRVCEEGWRAPLYWHEREGDWHEFTLAGLRPLSLQLPACHVSYFEADAFARWFGARLPTEAEWEIASQQTPLDGNAADQLVSAGRAVHPSAATRSADQRAILQMFGDAWQWTSSSYAAYPGYQPASGALGEYNGKFMCNQYVLRGGSCATPSGHVRRTYRNFFPADARWQFSGIRLARSA